MILYQNLWCSTYLEYLIILKHSDPVFLTECGNSFRFSRYSWCLDLVITFQIRKALTFLNMRFLQVFSRNITLLISRCLLLPLLVLGLGSKETLEWSYSLTIISCLVVEGINNYDALLDFDRENLQSFPATCKEPTQAIAADTANGIAAKPSVAGATISLISVQHLVVSMNAAKYYSSNGRTMNSPSMHRQNVLTNFQLD